MRIISAFIVLRIVLILFFPQIAMAAEVEKSNETKINFKIQDSGVMDINLALENRNSVLLAYDPHNFNNSIAPIKSTDPAREKVLAKYEEKRKLAKLPEGKFTINASAYTAAADECGKSDGITASGLLVKENETIACPPQFPFGTKIQIDGMGTYVCEDRGGAIKGNHVDIYMETKKEAFAFGRKNLLAEVVK